MLVKKMCDHIIELKEEFILKKRKIYLLLRKERRVLSIECSDEWWRPVTYLLKSLNEIERNYEIYDKKMLVVIRELEN